MLIVKCLVEDDFLFTLTLIEDRLSSMLKDG